MAVTKTSGSSVQLIKPTCLVATLYTGATAEKVNAPAGDTYIFEEVVRDTTKISQEDNDTTTIENEFSDDPIKEIVKLGKFSLEAEVADVQQDILKNFGNYKLDAGKLYAPASYKETYAKIAFVFPNGTDTQGKEQYMAFVVPKLQLNSQLLIESTNSNLVRLKLAGTAKSVNISDTIKSALYIDNAYTIPTATTAAGGGGTTTGK